MPYSNFPFENFEQKLILNKAVNASIAVSHVVLGPVLRNKSFINTDSRTPFLKKKIDVPCQMIRAELFLSASLSYFFFLCVVLKATCGGIVCSSL